jgi:long-chain-fatty-acid--CoA ligase ACSBG
VRNERCELRHKKKKFRFFPFLSLTLFLLSLDEKKVSEEKPRKDTAETAKEKAVPVTPKKKKSDSEGAAEEEKEKKHHHHSKDGESGKKKKKKHHDDDDDDDDEEEDDGEADDEKEAGGDEKKKKKSSKEPVSAAAVAAAPASTDATPESAKKASPDTLSPRPREAAPFWRTVPDACVEIRLAKTGVAARPPTTVMALLGEAVTKHGKEKALCWEEGDKWCSWSWQEYSDNIKKAAKSLIHLGMKSHEAVSIIGFNSKEWFVANMAAIAAGGKAAGIYTTNATDACKYIVEHSESRVVVCENEAQLKKFLPIRKDLKKVVAYVIWSGAVPSGANSDDEKSKVYDWAQFMALGADVADEKLDKRIKAQKPGECCTLIYTSGTTGNPKAVMITHDNITWTPQSVFGVLGADFGAKEEHSISYLPLSHVAAQMLDIHMPIAVTATRGGFATVWFARPDALKGSLKNTLTHVRPTLFFGVPRVWEKFAEAMQAVGAANTGIKKMLGNFAKGKALAKYEANQIGHEGGEPMFVGIAEKILNKARVALGFDRCRFMMTGAAPISRDTLRYFGSLNMPVHELYGMSESTGPQTLSYPGHYLVGSCGPVLPGCEIRIDHVEGRDKAGEGEILFAGRHIMLGYMKDDAKSAEAIDNDGWLHSGDVGRIDSYGFLHITGRIKELLITAGGENIAPVPMEDAIKSKLPGISNVVMIGDRRKYNVCLITLRLKTLDDGSFTKELVGASLNIGSPAKTVDEAQKCDVWKKYIETGITAANKEAVSNASKIQKHRILDTDFGVLTGELTATLKLKRPIVNQMYANVIESMYSEAGGD